MVLTNCNTEFLPLDSETATQTTFYKNEHHHHSHSHSNALHRQNATFNLLNSHLTNNNNNNNSSSVPAFGTVSNGNPAYPYLSSSNGYYGYVNNFSAANNHSLDDGTHCRRHDRNQQADFTDSLDSEMCVDEEVVTGATGILPFHSVCVVVDKRKRLDEGLDGYYEPAKRRRFLMANDANDGITQTMQTDTLSPPKTFGVQQSATAFKTHGPPSQSHYAIHRDSNRCMMSHFI